MALSSLVKSEIKTKITLLIKNIFAQNKKDICSKWKMSFMNILKSKRAVIKPCGTADIISSQVVDALLTLTVLLGICFLSNYNDI